MFRAGMSGIRGRVRAGAARAALVLLALASPAAAAQSIVTAPYFPLADGNSWTYQENGFGSHTRSVQGTEDVNGIVTKRQYISPGNEYEYYTNDAFGIRGHRGYYPSESVPGLEHCGTGERDTFSPPVVFAPASGTLGQIANSSGAVAAVLGTGAFPECSLSLTYMAQAQLVAFETVTVPAGTFVTLKVTHSRNVFYQGDLAISTFDTYWAAPNVGVVKSIESENGVTYTYTLSGTNVVRTAPDTFSFPPQTGVTPGSTATSDSITVTGTTATSSISVTGGEYRINSGPFTGTAGSVSNGQTVTVRQTASASGSTTTNTVLTIGGVNATFAVTTAVIPTHALTVNVTGSGTVSSNPAGITNCGSSCMASFLQGAGVGLTPAPGSEYQFAGWGGDCSGTGGCNLTMNGPRTVSATFTLLPDTQAPTVPGGVTARASGSSQVDLSWSAASDNRGVTQYKIHRSGVEIAAVGGLATRYADTGLTALTGYSYTVQACDAAGNCSAQSQPAAATTLAPGQFSFLPELESGFNLTGNALGAALDVVAIFGNQDGPVPGVTQNVVSVWKWDAVMGRWAFFSPQLTGAANAAYAASRNYAVLSMIDPGEGYWVNAASAVTLPEQTGTGHNWNQFNFGALVSGFSLISGAGSTTPSLFNQQVSQTPPSPGVVPIDNFVSLWMWDAALGKWYFYSPILESTGGLAAVKAYADSRSYLHFQDYGKTLGIGAGFWVNKQ